MAYDIIGDIHGHADKLHALLADWAIASETGPFGIPIARPSSSAISSTAVPVKSIR